MPLSEEVTKRMDDAAIEAQDELADLNPDAVEVVRVWWEKWYLKTGHKRLGIALVKGI